MGLIYSVLHLLGVMGAVLLAPFSEKLRRGLSDRMGLLRRIDKHCGLWQTRPMWFHVASSGELEQCIPILEAIKQKDPKQKLFLSYFSPSGKKAIQLEIRRRKGWDLPLPWDYADYSPFDFRVCVRSFIKTLHPTHFVTINREIWPNLVQTCQAAGIPCYLFSSFFWKRSQRVFPLYKPWLKRFQFVGTVEKGTADFLKARLKGPSIEQLGDPRIERVLSRKERQVLPFWLEHFKGQNVLLLGSVWPKDFEALAPSLERFIRERLAWRIVIAPHQPTEAFVRDLVNWFKAKPEKIRLWSNWLKTPDSKSNLIIDRVGNLAELYQIASAVYVGGSFVGRVHNVLEPAAYGNAIFTGPYIDNSAEALEMNEKNYGLKSLADGKDLHAEITKLDGDRELLGKLSNKSRQYLLERTGAGERYAAYLLSEN